MRLKIDNITEELNSVGQVWISNKAFEEDVRSIMDYYIRNKDTESGPLLERALEGDIRAFGVEYLTRHIYPNGDHSIAVEDASTDRMKLVRL